MQTTCMFNYVQEIEHDCIKNSLALETIGSVSANV